MNKTGKEEKKDTANSNYGEKQEITEDKKIAVHNNLTILIKQLLELVPCLQVKRHWNRTK